MTYSGQRNFVCLSACFGLSVCLFVCLSACLFVFLPILVCLFVCLSIFFSGFLSVFCLCCLSELCVVCLYMCFFLFGGSKQSTERQFM